MLVSKAARRYAIALLELADEQNVIPEVLDDVRSVQDTIEGSRELLLFLKSPIVKPDKKSEALQELFSDELGDLFNKFLVLIASKNRADILDEIVQAFIDSYNEHAGIINIEARVARSLSDDQQSRLKEELEKVTQKSVILHMKEQPDLKGGLMVKINDTVIDGSIKHKLDQLEELFLDTSVE